MKISKQKRKLLEIIACRDKVTSNEFYSIFIGRFPARLNEMKKDWGINYLFKNGAYYFPKWSQEKAREIISEVGNEFREVDNKVDNEPIKEELNSLPQLSLI